MRRRGVTRKLCSDTRCIYLFHCPFDEPTGSIEEKQIDKGQTEQANACYYKLDEHKSQDLRFA